MPLSPTLNVQKSSSVQTDVFMRLPEELIVKTLREVALNMRKEDEAFGEL